MKMVIDLAYKRPEDILPVLDDIIHLHPDITTEEYVTIKQLMTAIDEGEVVNEDWWEV